MNTNEAILTQTVEQLERMNVALTTLHRELLPDQPKKFAILAEGPLEDIRRLQVDGGLDQRGRPHGAHE